MSIILYHAPFTCSLASRLALIESGLEFSIQFVSTVLRENLTPEYLSINPAGKVPTLSVDGRIITESTAILPLIATLAPKADLMPMEPMARAQAQSILSYLSSELHPCWTHIFRPEKFVDGDQTADVRTAGIRRLNAALDLLEERMKDRDFVFDHLTVCDLYLAVYLSWRLVPVTQGLLTSTPALDRLYARVFARPGLQAALDDDMAKRGPPPLRKAG